MNENERFELVFPKTGSINSGTGFRYQKIIILNLDSLPNPSEGRKTKNIDTSFKGAMQW
jgi:hypothetical protein